MTVLKCPGYCITYDIYDGYYEVSNEDVSVEFYEDKQIKSMDPCTHKAIALGSDESLQGTNKFFLRDVTLHSAL